MATVAHLDPITLSVVPGEHAVFTASVTNDSLIVESYTLTPVGPVSAWTTIDPVELTIYPGKTETTTLTVSPPRAAEAVTGDVAVGVHAQPAEQPDFAASAEATLSILPFSSVNAELIPRLSRGRGRKRVRVAVDNQGNTPLVASIAGTSSDALAITTATPDVVVDPGHAVFVDIDLVPRARVWKGSDVTHPFGITVVPEGEQAPIELNGSYTQQRVFPRWLWKVLLALLLLLAALVALWFLVFKPAIEATAKQAIDGPVADANRRSDAAAQQADKAAASANEAKAAVGQPTEPVAPVAPGPTVSTDNVDLRLTVTVGPGATGKSANFAIPANSVLKITDVVISNPQGDFGKVTLENQDTVAPIFTSGLENFRDLDFHFVTPIEVQAGDNLFSRLTCAAVGTPPPGTAAPTTCSSQVLVTGVVVTTH
ncbi:hypothetical protein WDJ51_11970 [Rathayibacter sp. YIM 133350]|uniref:COG1470 family protein n=1 Tax=Rathayibacter sp. YIM 133350 TaxID=3131992 RepID=UPI00307D4A92